MYKQDIETAKLIASTQRPIIFHLIEHRQTNQKNLDVSRIIKGWNMGAAVQSTDPDVLKQ